MVDITHKSSTLRYARAQAIVKMGSPATMESIKNKSVPKGDVFEMAKAAALFAIKRTSDVIPDCHPLPIEFAAVHYFPEEMELKIEVEVKTIYKTGVEVEAMHGASIAALTAYDMLKPIDKHIEITGIKLIEKKGGKTDFKEEYRSSLSAAVIVCSDSISAGQKEDRAGKAIINKLEFLKVKVGDYTVIPDEQDKIRETVQKLAAAKYNMVILTGGTGSRSPETSVGT